MAPEAYNISTTHAHEISRWTILSRLLHARSPHIGGMDGDIRSDLATLVFNNGEQIEDFYSIIIILQQEINLYGETFSPTRLLLHYTKELSNLDKFKV